MKLSPQTKREIARWYKLKDHPVQLALVDAVPSGVRFPLVPSGRRCLERGTLVATPSGPRAIESLRVGDEVIGFDGDKPHITYVTETHVNGQQWVMPLLTDGAELLAATLTHKLWACVDGGEFERVEVQNLGPRHWVQTADGVPVQLSAATMRLADTFDITVANSTNLYCLHRGGVVTSNSGKTERFKRFLTRQAMAVPGQYFAAAPTHDQAKKIFWNDLLLLSFASRSHRAPNVSDRIIYFDNGSEIHVLGLDKPQRIEGLPWSGGGIDEFADIKDGAWEENILPALSTEDPTRPGYRAWCWLLGVPDGLNHYYELCERAKLGDDPNFKVFHWKSAEILSPEVIASMRRAMSARQFRQEFEAEFANATGRIYEDYGTENTSRATILPHEELLWMHDQNYTPLSSAIGVIRNGSLYLLDEIVLESAISRQSALEFVERYATHQNRRVQLFGDPAGRAGEKHGHASDYTDIESVLRGAGWQVDRRVKKAAPAIKDRQNAVRAKICAADGARSLFVNPAKAEYCHKGLSTVQLQPGSSFQEDQRNKYQHITTAIGYCVDVLWPALPAYTLEHVT